MIHVVIIEDDQVIREGIQEFINFQPDMICDSAKESVESFLAILN